jgi:hypothetical protein
MSDKKEKILTSILVLGTISLIWIALYFYTNCPEGNKIANKTPGDPIIVYQINK